MSVIQPMYFAAGKYSAGTVRKHLSSLFQSASDGTRLEGVVRSFDGTYSMKVVPNSGRNLLVKTGLCVIADKATQSLAAQDVDQPGFYIAGVDDTDHDVTIAANATGSTRYDLVYAEVSETSFTVTNKALSSNVATLTTSATHGFATGQTVVVSGVDDTFDGQYIIASVPTTTTFTYAKTYTGTISSTAVTPYMQIGSNIKTISNKALSSNLATITTAAHGLTLTSTNTSETNGLITVSGVDDTFNGTFHVYDVPSTTTIRYYINRTPLSDVASTAVSATSSNTAKAQVPFAVKVLTGTTSTTPALPSNTNSIALARVTVANGATTISSGNISDRRVFAASLGGAYIYDSSNTAITQPTLPEGSLSYDTSTNVFQYYDADATAGSGKTFSLLTVSGSGSSTTTASRSDHTHSDSTEYLGISQVSNVDAVQSSVFDAASDSTILSANKTYLFEGTIYFTDSSSPTTPYTVSFSFNCLQTISYITFSFITRNQTTNSSVTYSGYHSTTDGASSFAIMPSSINPANSKILSFKGVFVTSSSVSATVNPLIDVFGTVTTEAGSYIKFLEVGTNTATVINGTWS